MTTAWKGSPSGPMPKPKSTPARPKPARKGGGRKK